MFEVHMALKIDPEFRDLIPPLTAEEYAELEASIVREGCRDSLIVWKGHNIIVDGHNRYEICQKHEKEHNTFFRVTEMDFADRDAVKVWMYRNAVGRRNMSDMEEVELAMKVKPLLEKEARKNLKTSTGGPNPQPLTNLSKAERVPINTRAEVAKLAGVSEGTVAKVEKIVNSPVKELARFTRENKVSINAAAAVAELPEEQQREAVAEGPQRVKDVAKVQQFEKRRAKAVEVTAQPEPATPSEVPQPRGKALDYAYKAIALLQQIPPDDGLRGEALATVVRWCKHNWNSSFVPPSYTMKSHPSPKASLAATSPIVFAPPAGPNAA